MKKIIYLNGQTNEEVHYGEYITFKESGTYKNGGKWESTLTFPIVNETIPTLIKKGVLVQKEVEEREKSKKTTPADKEFTVDEKLDILLEWVYQLLKRVRQLESDVYEEDEDEDD